MTSRSESVLAQSDPKVPAVNGGKKMKSAGHFGAGLDDLIYPKESVSLSSRRTVVPMDAPAEGGDVPYEICKKKWPKNEMTIDWVTIS